MNMGAEYLKEQIDIARSLTDKPFGVNVMLMSPHTDEVAKLLADEKISVVTTGAGNPSKYMEMWNAAGVKVIPVVASSALAKKLENMGACAIIAEGGESGGHVGDMTTMALVPQVCDAVNIPVIAAGGICAAVLPDALHKEESSISNGTVTTTTAAPASTDTENSDQAPETYQSVLSEYYTAFIQNQPDTLYRLMAPPAYWDYYMEHYNKTKEDVISTYQQAITNTMASWKQQCGDDVTVSFAIKGMSEQSQDFLTEWTDDMNEMIGEDQVHAQDAVTLNVERTLTGSKGTQTETISPTLIQVDGFWYILQENTTAADSQQATE